MAISLIAILIIVVFSSNEPRGSDQFWYVADAISVSNGVFTTNNVFPNSMQADSDALRPFVQNRPIVYLAGALVYFGLNAVLAYKIINLSCLILIGLFLDKLLVHAKASSLSRQFALALVVGTPAIIFSLFNPLTQIFDALLIISIFYFLLIGIDLQKSNIKQFLFICIAAIVSIIAVMQRQDFLLFIAAFPLILLFSNSANVSRGGDLRGRIGLAAVYITIFLTCKLLLKLPTHLGSPLPAWSAFTVGSQADWGNMVVFFADLGYLNSLDYPRLIKSKSLDFLYNLIKLDILLTPLNLFLVCFFIVAFFEFKYRRYSGVLIVATLMVLTLFLVFLSFQYQYRYAIFLLPIIIYILLTSKTYFYLGKRFQNLTIVTIYALMFSSVIFSYAVASRISSEGKEVAAFLESLPNALSVNGNILVIYEGGSSLSVAYRYPDSKVFYVTPSTLDRDFWNDVTMVLDRNSRLNNTDRDLFDGLQKFGQAGNGWQVWVKP